MIFLLLLCIWISVGALGGAERHAYTSKALSPYGILIILSGPASFFLPLEKGNDDG